MNNLWPIFDRFWSIFDRLLTKFDRNWPHHVLSDSFRSHFRKKNSQFGGMNSENVISRIFPVGKYKFLSMRYIFIKHLWKWKNGSFLKRNHNEAFFSFSFRSSGLSYRFHNRILMKNKNHIRITRRVMGCFRTLHPSTKMGLSLWHLCHDLYLPIISPSSSSEL